MSRPFLLFDRVQHEVRRVDQVFTELDEGIHDWGQRAFPLTCTDWRTQDAQSSLGILLVVGAQDGHQSILKMKWMIKTMLKE